jgi:hypothetical protein
MAGANGPYLTGSSSGSASDPSSDWFSRAPTFELSFYNLRRTPHKTTKHHAAPSENFKTLNLHRAKTLNLKIS